MPPELSPWEALLFTQVGGWHRQKFARAHRGHTGRWHSTGQVDPCGGDTHLIFLLL